MNKVAIVTGANQGLGFALVETLCKELGSTASVYLTARNAGRGEAAISKMAW
jgi:carbonyl reductase 1